MYTLKQFLYYGFTLSCSSLSSCGTMYPAHHMLYAPMGVNSFFMVQKNEAHAKAAYRKSLPDENTDAGSHTDGADFSAAYSISDHIGIMATHSFNKEKDKYNNNDESILYKRTFSELSVGYFTTLRADKRLFFEIYGGYGYGSNQLSFFYNRTYAGGYYNNKSVKLFFQPAIIFHPTPTFQMGFITKLSFLKYQNIKTDYTNDNLSDPDVRLLHAGSSIYSFLEPSYSMQFPFSKNGWLKGTSTIGGSIKTGGPSAYHRPMFLTVGLLVDAHRISFK